LILISPHSFARQAGLSMLNKKLLAVSTWCVLNNNIKSLGGCGVKLDQSKLQDFVIR
jgi:hypothetical protein